MPYKTSLSCWNNYPSSTSFVIRPEGHKQLTLAPEGTSLARGLGRSYGDAALNADNLLILMERLNRMIAFDEKSGLLQVEAGVTIEEILKIFMPRGWFLPVTPGTQYVTLGGCFAADVHGKNHHMDGSFCRYVKEIELLLADGSRMRCSPSQNSEVFWATAGGMGLTGIITELTIQLVPIETPVMLVTHHVANNFDQLLGHFSNPDIDDKYSVAWIDCLSQENALGRGVLMTAHHATKAEIIGFKKCPQACKSPSLSVPFYFPNAALNYWSVKTFNHFYFKTQSRKDTFLCLAEKFFYPLDRINHWNRIYGRRGFLQYQCVIPFDKARQALAIILRKLSNSRRASFLAVIKRFGDEGQGLLSFPREGVTLALDIPIADREVFALLDQLDNIVLSFGGRVYLAKDARLKPEAFKNMYPRLEEWQKIKAKIDPQNRFMSDLAHRLMIGKKV